MRTFITIISIIALLIGLVSAEQIIIGQYCDNFLNEVINLKTNLYDDKKSFDIANKIADTWEKQKKNIFIFSNHNNFKDIESGIYDMKFYVDKAMPDYASYYINSLYFKLKELRESIRLNPANLL